jgi:hypothetical protein
MSENKVRRAFRTTKIKVNKDTVPSVEQRQALDNLFLTMEAAKTDAVAAERAALISKAKAQTQIAKAQIAEVEFLQAASSNFAQVAGDRMWIIYRDKEGIITLEGFTERLLRNNLRAQQEMLGSQLENNGGDDIDRSGLYESDDEGSDAGPDPDAN